MSDGQKRLREITADARAKQGRLTRWELAFLETLERYVERNLGTEDLSAAQHEAFVRIENKIYASG